MMGVLSKKVVFIMSETPFVKLHWSVDHSYHHSPFADFTGELLRRLGGYFRDADGQAAAKDFVEKTCCYAILSNFWSGYHGDDRGLPIGEAAVTAKKEEGGWLYGVTVDNSTRGERLECRFQCADNPRRTLQGRWTMEVQYPSTVHYIGPDMYRGSRSSGRVAEGEGINCLMSAREGMAELPLGEIPDTYPITCSWALPDSLPLLAALPDSSALQEEFSILEDLEYLRTGSRFRRLETWVLPVGGTPRTLSGYCLSGTGSPPSYWWVDGAGNTVLISTIFSTYILESAERRGGAARG